MILQLVITGAPLQLNLFGILPLKQPIFSLLDSFLLITLLPVFSSNAEAHSLGKHVSGLTSQPWPLGSLGRSERGRGAGVLRGLRYIGLVAVWPWANRSCLWAQIQSKRAGG